MASLLNPRTIIVIFDAARPVVSVATTAALAAFYRLFIFSTFVNDDSSKITTIPHIPKNICGLYEGINDQLENAANLTCSIHQTQHVSLLNYIFTSCANFYISESLSGLDLLILFGGCTIFLLSLITILYSGSRWIARLTDLAVSLQSWRALRNNTDADEGAIQRDHDFPAVIAHLLRKRSPPDQAVTQVQHPKSPIETLTRFQRWLIYLFPFFGELHQQLRDIQDVERENQYQLQDLREAQEADSRTAQRNSDDIARLLRPLQTFEEDIIVMKNTNTAREQRKTALEKDNTDLRGDKNTLTKQYGDLQKQRQNLMEKLQGATETNARLNQDLKSPKEQTASAERNLEALNEFVDNSVKTEKRTAVSEKLWAKEKSEMEQELNKSRAAARSAEARAKEASKAKGEYETKLRKLQKDSDTMKGECESTNGRSLLLQEKNEKLQQELALTQEDLRSSQSGAAATTQQVKCLEQELEAQKAKHQNDSATTSEQLAAKDVQINGIEQELEAIRTSQTTAMLTQDALLSENDASITDLQCRLERAEADKQIARPFTSLPSLPSDHWSDPDLADASLPSSNCPSTEVSYGGYPSGSQAAPGVPTPSWSTQTDLPGACEQDDLVASLVDTGKPRVRVHTIASLSLGTIDVQDDMSMLTTSSNDIDLADQDLPASAEPLLGQPSDIVSAPKRKRTHRSQHNNRNKNIKRRAKRAEAAALRLQGDDGGKDEEEDEG